MKTITYNIKIGDYIWFSTSKLREARQKVKMLLDINKIEQNVNELIVIEKETVKKEILNQYNDNTINISSIL